MSAIDVWRVERITAHVAGLDAVAAEMERKWGVGRLPLLVDAEWRAKFESQRRKVNVAIYPEDGAADPDVVAKALESMAKGWRTLDQLATAAGAQPIDPVVWEARLSDGRVLALARSDAEASHLARTRDGRETVVWTLAEVARVIEGQQLVNQAKEAFPGSKVVDARMGGRGSTAALDDVAGFA